MNDGFPDSPRPAGSGLVGLGGLAVRDLEGRHESGEEPRVVAPRLEDGRHPVRLRDDEEGFGFDKSETNPLPNGVSNQSPVLKLMNVTNALIGGTTEHARNVITGGTFGIEVSGGTSIGVAIHGNYIGVAPDGVTKAPIALMKASTGGTVG